MERGQFTFYKSFADAAQQIKSKAARCDFYDSVCAYALYEKEPDLSKIADAAAMGFTLVRPILDAGRRKAKSGQKGGKTETRESGKQTASKREANRKQVKEQEKEQDKEKEQEQMFITPPTPSPSASPFTFQRKEAMILESLSGHSDDLILAAREWTRYKAEKRQTYQETGYKSLLTQIRKRAEEYGDAAVCDVIRESMGSNYSGIMFDRLKRGKAEAPRVSKTQEMVNSGRWSKPRDSQEMAELMKGLDKI